MQWVLEVGKGKNDLGLPASWVLWVAVSTDLDRGLVKPIWMIWKLCKAGTLKRKPFQRLCAPSILSMEDAVAFQTRPPGEVLFRAGPPVAEGSSEQSEQQQQTGHGDKEADAWVLWESRFIATTGAGALGRSTGKTSTGNQFPRKCRRFPRKYCQS